MTEDLNLRDEHGMTPLLRAIFIGDVEQVRALLADGADPNVPAASGELPLWYAEDDFGLDEIAQLLRAAGARKTL